MWNRHCSRWSASEMILAAMVGTIAVVAVAGVISMILAPPSIFFYIKDVSLQNKTANGASFYNFTLVAYNSGRRMEARYEAVRTEIWINATFWVLTEFYSGSLMAAPQPPMNITTVNGSAEFIQYDQLSMKPSVTASEVEMTWPRCAVVVVARVRFSYGGLACTRPYTITVVCKGVDFLHRTTGNASCTV